MLYIKNKLIIILLTLSAVLNSTLWLILVFAVKNNSGFPLILHYNALYGADILGQHYELYSLPITGMIIFAVNSALGFFAFKQKKPVLNYILLSTALVCQIFLITAGIALIIINK